MSLPELLTAVKSRLATLYTPTWVADRNVCITNDGQPEIHLAGFPDFFIGIAATKWGPGETNDDNPGLHEIIDFQVVVTKKISYLPNASFDKATYDATVGIYKIVRQVVLGVNNSYAILTLANAAVSGRDFITTPKWKGSDPQPELVGPEWLGVTNPKDAGKHCLVVRSRFGGVERMQCSESETIV